MKSYFVALDSQFKSVLGMKKFSLSLKYDDKLGNTVSEMLPTIQYCMYLRDTIVFFFEDHGKKSFLIPSAKMQILYFHDKLPFTAA